MTRYVVWPIRGENGKTREWEVVDTSLESPSTLFIGTKKDAEKEAAELNEIEADKA